jgi:putative toxin-antitoxin system antitoxin component (TIGR02293 family)
VLTSDDRAEIKQLIADALQNEDDHKNSPAPAWVNKSAYRNGETTLDPVINITARAIEVLGTREKALNWLRSPVRALGDVAPVSLLSTDDGITQIEDVLGRIEHGLW